MEIILAAVVAFITTNIDDIFLLAIYFTQVNATLRPSHIVLGQYLGFAGIFAVSLLGFFGAFVIPEEIIGLLGFAPIYMGVRRLLQKPEETADETVVDVPHPAPQDVQQKPAILDRQTYSVAVVTMANGGDNISIYIPLFAGRTGLELVTVLGVFAVLIAVWCYAGYRLGNYPLLARNIQRYGHIIVPFVLIGLGIFILLENHTLQWIIGLFQ